MKMKSGGAKKSGGESEAKYRRYRVIDRPYRAKHPSANALRAHRRRVKSRIFAHGGGAVNIGARR